MTAAVLAEQLRRVLPSDSFEGREPRDVTGALTALTKLADDRRPGEPRVAVYTPTLTENGWTSYRTIVQICTDDSPFLVDSVTAAIADADLTVHLLLHPILSVSRDADGFWGSPPTTACASRGCTSRPTASRRTSSALRCRRASVRTRRCPRSGGRLGRHAAHMPRHRPTCAPPLRPRWPRKRSPAPSSSSAGSPTTTSPSSAIAYALDVVDGEDVLRPVPGSGLGILRDAPTRRASPTGSPGDSASPPALTVTKANSRATVHRPVYLDYVGVRTFDDVGNVTGERRLIGLFTSTAYASVLMLPVIAAKVSAVLEASGHARVRISEEPAADPRGLPA